MRTVFAPATITIPLEIAKPASGEVALDASNFETTRLLFFDRYSIYRTEHFLECHFGFYGHARELQNGLLVVLPRLAIDEQKASYMQYLQQIGMPEPGELLPCNLRGEAEVISADLLGMARHGEALAEISFHIFSWKVVVEKVKTAGNKDPLRAVCAALLRCDIELQKRFILDLYEDRTGESKAS